MNETDAPTAAAYHIPRVGEKLLIPIAEVIVRSNTRKTFDAESLGELADSIKRNGQLTPVIVHREDGTAGYILDAGERRLRAFQQLAETNEHFSRIEALLRDDTADLKRRLVVQLIENSQREDLPPAEQADAIQDYIEATESSAEAAAADLGWPVKRVQNYCELANAPSYLKPFGKGSLRVPVPVLDEHGNQSRDEEGKKLYKKKKVDPLPFVHLHRLAKLAVFLDRHDENARKKNDRAKPIAEKTVLKTATKAAAEGWSYKRIRDEEKAIRKRLSAPTRDSADGSGEADGSSSAKPMRLDASAFEKASHAQRMEIAQQVNDFFASFGWTVIVQPKDPGPTVG